MLILNISIFKFRLVYISSLKPINMHD